jgi:hypothetical protein
VDAARETRCRAWVHALSPNWLDAMARGQAAARQSLSCNEP